MTKHLRADGGFRGAADASLNVKDGNLRPALASIPSAIDYLGGPSRAKFYSDLLPRLDIVRFGGRTFVTFESLDRLIAAHRQSAR